MFLKQAVFTGNDVYTITQWMNEAARFKYTYAAIRGGYIYTFFSCHVSLHTLLFIIYSYVFPDVLLSPNCKRDNTLRSVPIWNLVISR